MNNVTYIKSSKTNYLDLVENFDSVKSNHFDLVKSLKECDPKKNILRVNGGKFIRRVVTPIDSILVVTDDQIRQFHTDAYNLSRLVDSLLEFGYIHDRQPPIVEWDENTQKFKLKNGYHRYTGMKQLGWTEIMVDIYEYDSPLDATRHQIASNVDTDPRKPVTQNDIIQTISRAITNNELNNNEKDITSFIDSIPGIPSRWKSKILVGVLNTNGTYVRYVTYSAKGQFNNTEIVAKQIGIPYGGREVNGYRGYITGEGGGSRMTLLNMIKKFVEVNSSSKNMKPIYIFAYIQTPNQKSDDLKIQREAWEYSFFQNMDAINAFVEIVTGIKPKNPPFIFGGFLPQDHSNDSSKNGKKKETTIVNKDGDPINWVSYYN